MNKEFSLLKKLFDAQPMISFATSGDYKLVSWNRGFENFFESKLAYDRDIRDIVPTINDKWIDEMLLKPYQPKKINFSKGQDNYVFNAYFNISYVERACLYIYTFVDVTELEELKDREYLQAKMVSIGELSLGLTHEVNTPLTYIRGSADLMEMDLSLIDDMNLKELFEENLKAIQNGVERIQLIIDLLQEYGSNCNEVSQVLDLTDVIYDIYLFLYHKSKYIANIYFNGELLNQDYKRIHCLDESKYVTFPKNQLIKILLVILQNSLEQLSISHILFEERRIDISIKKHGYFSEILIEDNGGGIPENILKNLFKPFTSGKSQSGMGLGLNIAKKMIEGNGGKIFAENSQNGAVFHLIIH